jgi:hypothetical protein
MKMIKVPKSVQGILVPKNFPEKHTKNPILVDRYIDPHPLIFKMKKKKEIFFNCKLYSKQGHLVD